MRRLRCQNDPMNRIVTAALVALSALALAACKVDATVDVRVEADGSGEVTVMLVADKALVDAAPGLAGDLRFEDAVAAGWTASTPEATDEGGLRVVVSHPFTTVDEATALLQSVNSVNGPIHDVVISRIVTSDDITTTMTGTLRVDGGVDAFADPDLLAIIGGAPYADNITNAGLRPADAISFTYRVNLPGESVVRDGVGSSGLADGSGDDQVLTWSVPIDGTAADLATTTVLAQGRPASAWGTVATLALGGLVVWSLLAAGFILFVAKARRERALRHAGGSGSGMSQQRRPPQRYR